MIRFWNTKNTMALGAFTLRGLRTDEDRLDVHVDHDGLVRVEVTKG